MNYLFQQIRLRQVFMFKIVGHRWKIQQLIRNIFQGLLKTKNINDLSC